MHIRAESKVGRAARALLPAAVLTVGVVVGGLAPSTAQAQLFDWGSGWGNGGGWGNDGIWDHGGGWGGSGPAQISRVLSEHGFRVIAPLRRNGPVFVADVVDRRGRRERLIVASADGQILRRFIIDEQPTPRRAAPRSDDDMEQQMEHADRGDGSAPVPPAPIPNVGGYNRDFGNTDGDPVIEPMRPRSSPKLIVRPAKPRLVERTPDGAQPDAVPMEPEAAPSQPTRPKLKPLQLQHAPVTSGQPGAPATVTASRPAEPVATPSASPPAASAPVPAASAATGAPASGGAPPSTHMRDPLAIPRDGAKATDGSKPNTAVAAEPRKIAPGIVTGSSPDTQIRKVTSAPKAGDVPVAPLD